MILRINGGIIPDVGGGALDNFVEAGAEAVGSALVHYASMAVTTLNTWSPEIITLGIVTCAVGMMVGPLVGSTKWLGRLFVTFWIGVIWRVLI